MGADAPNGRLRIFDRTMGIWIILALMTGAAVLLLLLPLARTSTAAPRATDDVAFYQAQIAEIERDIQTGLIGATEADAARAEAARRLLRVGDHPLAAQKNRAVRMKLASFVALLLVPAVALPVYLYAGAPAMPDRPLAARRNADPAAVDIVEAVARIEAHLAKNPDDGRGYDVVAPVYFRMERYADAARALANAMRLLGENPARLSAFGEALVAQNGGIVTPDAKKSFEQALAMEARHTKSLYYLALAREQDGDRAGALADFNAMLTGAPDGAAWTEIVRERIAALSNRSGAVPQGGEALAALPAQEREAAIRAMVDGLEVRLNNQGGSLEEWARLIRAASVLGEKARALKALGAAREKLQADTAAPGALDALEKELGLRS